MKFQPEAIETGLHRFVGAVLGVVSTGALVMLLISLPMDDRQLYMAVAAGVALQCCLYLFARSDNRQQQVTAWMLLVMSVVATTGFMEYAWQKHLAEQERIQSEAVAGSFVVQQLQQEIADRNQQIKLMLQSSEIDISATYRDRSDIRMDKLQPLYKERDALMQQLAQQQSKVSNTGVAQGSLQALLTGVNHWIRLALFAALASRLCRTAGAGHVPATDAHRCRTESG